ncbi:MAG: GAF domain-containing protein, partial [Treponema sp.]|nr:GAF domain-containing protein [Treponema sp.]
MSIKILSPRLIFKNQIYSRNIYVFLLMLIIILLTSIVTIIVSNVSSKTSRDLNLFYTTEAAAKFDSYISRNLILVQNTSLSKAVCDWFTDEENPDKKLAAFDQIMHLNNMLPDAQLYLSISNSLNEYSIQDDLTAVNNLVPLDKLDWSIPADRRYFNCIASGNEYTFSIGMEKLTQKWLFWINYKVIDGGNVVGTLCAGLKMQPLFDDMFGQFNNNDIRGFIIDNRGVIQMDSDFPDFITDENGTHIHTVSSDPAFITTVDAFLDSINGISDTNTDPEVVKLTKGPYEFASVAQINDSEWSVIVLTNGYSLAGILDCMPLLITVLAGFFLYMIANNILIGRLVIKPLGRLKETLPEPGTDGSNIFGYERSDEIGDLARGIRKISDRVSINQTENEQRRSLMHAINNAASILLLAEVRENFKASLMSVMELMGTCVDIDRINIWRNEEIDGENSINCQCEWLGSINRLKNTFRAETKFPYDVKFFWEEKIRRGECINGSVSGFSKEIQEFLQPYEIKSILVVPIHIENHFWGFFSFDDCRKERIFTEDEVNVLNSASLMMVNAVNRNEQANKVLEAHQRTKLIMDAMPLCTNLWDRNLRPFDCNEEAVKLYNMADKQEFLDRFFDLSPEYQPDGQFSKGKALMLLQKAFDEGKCTFEWMHQQLDGTPMPSEVTLVRVSYDEGYAVVSYIRDLREYKQMMKEIEQRDRLLHAVNETATILLQAEYEKIGYYLQYCMGMLGEAVGVDRVYLWRNHTKDGELYCTQMYEWSEGAEPLQDSEYTVDVSYNEKCPEWKETLIKGNCINDLVSNMSVQTQSRLAPQGVLSVLIVPVFLRNEFWGFLGFDDCHTKRVFSKNAESILRSASLLIANVMLRNDMTESIRT